MLLVASTLDNKANPITAENSNRLYDDKIDHINVISDPVSTDDDILDHWLST